MSMRSLFSFGGSNLKREAFIYLFIVIWQLVICFYTLLKTTAYTIYIGYTKTHTQHQQNKAPGLQAANTK